MPCTARSGFRPSRMGLLGGGLTLALSDYLPMPVINDLVASAGVKFRNRCYPPALVLWTMVCQVLMGGTSDCAMVSRLCAWLGVQFSVLSGGYCSARKRLPVSVSRRAARYVADQAPQFLRAFPERRVFVLDGSSIDLADTPKNQAIYPQHSGQKPGCGFPLLHFVALMDHATGCIIDMVLSSLHVHDSRLARPLWERLQPGDILLADRGFAAYGLLAALKRRGVDVVIRQHHRREAGSMRRDVDDRVVVWRRPPKYPDWWRTPLPPTLPVRTVKTRIRGGKLLVVNTTLDADEYPAQVILDLYRSRWRIETLFNDLKTTLELSSVRPKSPRSARQAVWTHALAYNQVQCLLLDVAWTHDVDRSRLSFKRAVDALTAGVAFVARTTHRAWTWLIEHLGQCLYTPRPGRNEPRVLKQRLNKYRLMTRPRRLYQADLQHGRP
ncbi:MAG TPA: IS4 family transposase [Armatimonadota bacterium]|nr:IS4 family transposase [Armatimonadota bacterium]